MNVAFYWVMGTNTSLTANAATMTATRLPFPLTTIGSGRHLDILYKSSTGYRSKRVIEPLSIYNRYGQL